MDEQPVFAANRESCRLTMSAVIKENPSPSRQDVWRMFDRIAHRYDLLNHLLSLNRDRAWRKRLVQNLPDRSDLEVLDLATGTADQLIALYESRRVSSGVGVDPSERMLEIGQNKVVERKLESHLALVKGDCERIPFEDESFDAVTISFGIRNVTDVGRSLAEMYRVLRSDGRALILEFSLPKNALVRRCYLLYFRSVLPLIGGLISGDSYAYRYLNQTVETFPDGQEFFNLISQAGFRRVTAEPLTFGTATIYVGEK